MSTKVTRKSSCELKNDKFKFLLSSFADHEKIKLAKYILTLGGVYYETQEYKVDCTHIVSSKPIRSEKYLCGCAEGKWVVTKEYVRDSMKAGKWLDSRLYEWGHKIPTDSNYPLPLLTAPKRWRLQREATGKRPFSGWTAMILVENVKRRPEVYKRLLEAGGATVLSPRFTLQDLDGLAKQLTHVFVDRKYENNIKAFVRRGIPCVSPDYIAETLLQDVAPDTEPFSVSTYTSPLLSLTSSSTGRSSLSSQTTVGSAPSNKKSWTTSSVSSLPNSQTTVSSVPSNQKSSATTSTSASSSDSSSLSSSQTTTSLDSTSNSQRSSTDLSQSGAKLSLIGLTSSAASSKTTSPAGKRVNDVGPKLLTDTVKIALKEEEETKNMTPNKQIIDPRGVKRKLLQSEDIIRDIVLRVKKRKSKQSGPSFVPYCFQMLPLPKEKTKKCALPFNRSQINILEATMEEGMWCAVIHDLQAIISSSRYPPPSLMHQLMVEMVQTTNQVVIQGVYHLLKQLLCMHCPTTSPALRLMYLQSLSTTEYTERMEHVSGGEWDFVCTIISNSIGMDPEDVQDENDQLHTESDIPQGEESVEDKMCSSCGIRKNNRKSCGLLFQYLVNLFEQDFLGIVTRQRASPRKSPTKKVSQTRQCILSCLLWPDGYPGVISTAVVTLLEYLVRAIKLATAESNMTHLVNMVQRMVTIAAECYQQVSVVLVSASMDNERDFAKEILRAVQDGGILDCNESVSLLLQTTQPMWLRMRLAEAMLSCYDNRLVHPDNKPLLEKKLSLRKLVSCYFFMLPKTPASTVDGSPIQKPNANNIENKKPSSFRERKKSQKSGALQTLAKSNTIMGFEPSKRFPLSPSKSSNVKNVKKSQVNKRNMKGETPLHLACMRDNLSKVKELLTSPGIDVNARDNAGWTPLHEACNHGNLAIVKELLKFKRAPTILSFFGKGDKADESSRGSAVDLLAAPECGTTPLHDAVFTGHVSVARLLAKAGGEAVLTAKNSQGYTPVDCAASEEMKAALQTNAVGSSSSCSQESSCSSETPTWGGDSQAVNSSQNLSQAESFKSDGCSSTPSGDNSALYPSDGEYSQALKTGDGRKRRFSEGQCVQYAILVKQLIRSYLKVNDLHLLKFELDQTVSDPTVVLPDSQGSLPSSQNSETFAPCAKRSKMSDGGVMVVLDDYHCPPKLSGVAEYDVTSVADDLLCFTELGTHVKSFERHLTKISPGEQLPDFCKKLFIGVDILASQ